MQSAVSIVLQTNMQDLKNLLCTLYMWLKGPDDVWNDYLKALLNDQRVVAFIETQHAWSNRLTHFLTLFSLLVSHTLTQKRLLPPLTVLAIWRAFTGVDVPDDTSTTRLTIDAKILLGCIALLVAAGQTALTIEQIQILYDSIRQKAHMEQHTWPSNFKHVNTCALHFNGNA